LERGEGGLNVYAGLRFEFPIGNRAPKALYKRSTLELEQQDQALENMAQLAEQDVLSAYIEIARSSKQIVASSATVKYQKKKLEAEVEKYPEDPLAQYGYGLILARAGDRKDAIDHLKRALVKNAFDPYMLKDLGQIYFLDGQYREALNILENAASISSNGSRSIFLPWAAHRWSLDVYMRQRLHLKNSLKKR